MDERNNSAKDIELNDAAEGICDESAVNDCPDEGDSSDELGRGEYRVDGDLSVENDPSELVFKYDRKNIIQKLNELSMGIKILIYVLMSLISALLLFLVLSFWNVNINTRGFDSGSVMLSQMSSTFIVLSLTSALSTNVGAVYWQDIKDVKLIKPFFFCFYALTTYLITVMAVSVVGFFVSSTKLMLSAFIVSVTVLVVLTIKMLGVYFGREAIKRDLMWEYFKTYNSREDLSPKSDYYCKNLYEEAKLRLTVLRKRELKELKWLISLHDQDDETIIIRYYADDYRFNFESKRKWEEYSSKLIEKTIQAVHNNDEKLVIENIDLLLKSGDYDTYSSIISLLVSSKPDYALEQMSKAQKIKRIEAAYDPNFFASILTGYSIHLFRELIKSGSGTGALNSALDYTRDESAVKEEIIDIIYCSTEVTEETVQSIEERFKEVAILDTYFPSTELLEAYYCHKYTTCIAIVDAAHKIYSNEDRSFVRIYNKKLRAHGKKIIVAQVGRKLPRNVQFKYLPDYNWDQVMTLLKKDEELKALPLETKRKLEEMKVYTLKCD